MYTQNVHNKRQNHILVYHKKKSWMITEHIKQGIFHKLNCTYDRPGSPFFFLLSHQEKNGRKQENSLRLKSHAFIEAFTRKWRPSEYKKIFINTHTLTPHMAHHFQIRLVCCYCGSCCLCMLAVIVVCKVCVKHNAIHYWHYYRDHQRHPFL